MGASSSKPMSGKDEPIVFYNDAAALNVPVRFTPDLVKTLEKPPNRHASSSSSFSSSASPTITEEEFENEVRNRVSQIIKDQIEPKIRDEVERRVKKLEIAARIQEKEMEKKRMVEEGRENIDSNAACREVDDLLRRAGRSTPFNNPVQFKPSPIAVRAQEELKNCLLLNKLKPLDCYHQVEQFKESLKIIQQQFMEQSSKL